MSDDGNFWDPYCCCRVTRKNIVMTVMAIACFALVTWTIIATGEFKPPIATNVSFVFIDDTKSIDNLNITLTTLKQITQATARLEKQTKGTIDAVTDLAKNRKTAIRTIKSPDNESEILCQCMCDLSVTREEMLAAVQHIVDSRGRTRTTSTTPVPTTVAYHPEVDDW